MQTCIQIDRQLWLLILSIPTLIFIHLHSKNVTSRKTFLKTRSRGKNVFTKLGKDSLHPNRVSKLRRDQALCILVLQYSNRLFRWHFTDNRQIAIVTFHTLSRYSSVAYAIDNYGYTKSNINQTFSPVYDVLQQQS